MKETDKSVADFPDPLLDEMRAVKQAISSRAGHDVARLCRELRVEQGRSTHRIIRRKSTEVKAAV